MHIDVHDTVSPAASMHISSATDMYTFRTIVEMQTVCMNKLCKYVDDDDDVNSM